MKKRNIWQQIGGGESRKKYDIGTLKIILFLECRKGK